jgi:[acyl-carrier-protein] S-malonyltransferase
MNPAAELSAQDHPQGGDRLPPGRYPQAPAAGGFAAWVAGEPVTVAEIEVAMTRLRTSRHAALLPDGGGGQGRQLRRWMVQLVTSQRLVERCADRESVRILDLDRAPWRPTPVQELQFGSVAAAVLAVSPAARAVLRTRDVVVDDDELVEYLGRNLSSLCLVAARHVRRRLLPDGPWQDLGWLQPTRMSGTLGTAVATATVGRVEGPVCCPDGAAVIIVEADRPAGTSPAATVRTQLAGAARREAFVAWLEERRREHVVLAPGFEHPADPRQPDSTHRH